MIRLPPSFTLFPYTTLFRSQTTVMAPITLLAWPLTGTEYPTFSATRSPARRENPRSRMSAKWARSCSGQVMVRSEEHTSEHQSRGQLVCRLQHVKKKSIHHSH